MRGSGKERIIVWLLSDGVGSQKFLKRVNTGDELGT
jgi:hypothetical protein